MAAFATMLLPLALPALAQELPAPAPEATAEAPANPDASTASATDTAPGTPSEDLSAPVGPKEEYEEENYEVIEVEEIDREELLDKPMNLARWIMGAKLYTYERGHLDMADETNLEDGSPSVLLTKDPRARYPMYIDSYKFIIDLGDYWMINMFEFMNYGAQGRAQVFYSDVLQDPNSGQWKPASPIVPFSSDGKISMYLGSLDTRYLMLVVDNLARGELGPFAVYGDLKISQMRLAGGGLSQKELEALPMKEREKYRPVRYDWATLHSGCRISHVSSGDPRYSNAMIDDDLETIHQFKQEPETIIIMDLMEERKLDRMSMLFSSDPGLFEMYFVHKLPGDMRTQGREEIDDIREAQEQQAADGDTASLRTRTLPDGLLLAATPNSLGELLALSQLGQMTETTTEEIPIKITYMPREFFAETKPQLAYVSDGGQVSFRIEFQEISGRWCIIRFRRNFNSPQRYSLSEDAGLRAVPAPVKVSPYAFAPSPLTLLSQTGAEDSETSNGLRVHEISIFGEIFFAGDALEPVDSLRGGGNGEGSSTGGGGPGLPPGAPVPPTSPPPPTVPPDPDPPPTDPGPPGGGGGPASP